MQVSIIVLCHNHGPWVEACLDSVAAQEGVEWELLVVDDGSTDDSWVRIQAWQARHAFPLKAAWRNTQPLGQNRAFNQALAQASGEFVLDLAADDLLLPGRLAAQVARFQQAGAQTVLVFSNARFTDASGQPGAPCYPVNAQGQALNPPAEGQVLAQVLSARYILSTSMLFRTEALRQLGGYDESLSYEDYDIKIRLARLGPFAYCDAITTLKRRLPGSSAQGFFARGGGPHLESTLRIFEREATQPLTKEEKQALAQAVRWYQRLAWYTESRTLMPRLVDLLQKLGTYGPTERAVTWLSRMPLPWHALYTRWRKGRT